MHVHTVSLCSCGAEGTISTGEAEAEVETGADRGSFGGQSGGPWAG